MNLVIYYDPGSERIEVEEDWHDLEKAKERINWLKEQGATVKLIQVSASLTKEIIRN